MNMDEYNPWDVGNIEEFLYFCCPECNFSRGSLYQSRKLFMNHALSQHPKAKEHLTILEVKEEPIDQAYYDQDYFDPFHDSHSFVETKYDKLKVKDEFPFNQNTNGENETCDAGIEWYDSETIKNTNEGKINELNCKKCDFVAHNKQTLSRHSKMHRKCKKCEKDFNGSNSKRNYEAHIQTCDGEPCPEFHQCNNCSKVFLFK